MIRSGFKSKTYAQKLTAQKASKERLQQKAKAKPRKVIKTLLRDKKVAKKTRCKLPTVKTMRNKCDKLLTPIIKLQNPYCFLGESENCQRITQVAHHHVLKSQCTNLRYDIDNLIPLCTPCHMMLHSHETYWSSVIVEKKGMEWWLPLKAKKPIMVKADVHFYIENYERLSKILQDLTGDKSPTNPTPEVYSERI